MNEVSIIEVAHENLCMGVSNFSNYESRLFLYNEYLREPYNEENCREVLQQLYNEILKRKNNIPTMEEIGFEIEEYNNKIFIGMATLDIMEDYNDSIEELPEEEFDELVEEKVSSYIDYYSYNGMLGYEFYIYETLKEFNLNVNLSSENYSEIQDYLEITSYKNDQLFTNDAQTLLIPSLALDGFIKCNTTAVYYNFNNRLSLDGNKKLLLGA